MKSFVSCLLKCNIMMQKNKKTFKDKYAKSYFCKYNNWKALLWSVVTIWRIKTIEACTRCVDFIVRRRRIKWDPWSFRVPRPDRILAVTAPGTTRSFPSPGAARFTQLSRFLSITFYAAALVQNVVTLVSRRNVEVYRVQFDTRCRRRMSRGRPLKRTTNM